MVFDFQGKVSDMLHVWYSYRNIWLRFMVNVGKYSSPMEHLGFHSKKHWEKTPMLVFSGV